MFDIKFAQSADTMYICHPNHAPKKLTRSGHTNWTLVDDVIINGPFMDHNVETTTANPSHKSVGQTTTVTFSSTTGINANQGFLSTDVGRLVHIQDGHFKITSVTSTTVVVGIVIVDLGISSSTTTDFALGAFSDTTGYPSCVTFFEQRLVFAATTAQPQTIFFSRSADYENFNDNYHQTVADDDAIVYTIASNQVNAIRFLTATRTLIIGTAGGEFAADGGGTGEAVTPTNILINKQSNHGAANVDGISLGNATLFLQRAKRKIRELAYNFDVDGYVAPDLTILAEHITESGITQMAYQEEPNSIVWCVRTDGQLLGFTYQREQQVTAWHRHIFGGSFGSGNAVCESVEVLPTDDSEYQVWVIIKRTINGVTKRYVEYLHKFDFDETDDTSFNYLDSQLAYDGSATTTISGLDHLEGETVSVLADGSTHPNKVVSSGGITLDRSSTKVKVGLPYVSLLQTMRIDAGANNGTSQSKTKRIYEITARLYESIGIEIGPDLNNMERIPFRSSANPMDSGINVFTGDKEIEFRGNYETDGFIFVRQNQPLPLTVLSLYPRLITNDG
nr:putative tail tubular protein B [uncultured Mediterranean phage uvMED]